MRSRLGLRESDQERESYYEQYSDAEYKGRNGSLAGHERPPWFLPDGAGACFGRLVNGAGEEPGEAKSRSISGRGKRPGLPRSLARNYAGSYASRRTAVESGVQRPKPSIVCNCSRP